MRRLGLRNNGLPGVPGTHITLELAGFEFLRPNEYEVMNAPSHREAKLNSYL